MNSLERATEIIDRWRPYMKLFGPSKGFPVNDVSMLDDIKSALDAHAAEVEEDRNRWADSAERLEKKLLEMNKLWDKHYEEGIREGMEMAAGMCEDHYPSQK